jgi:hypothetical protein
LVKKYYFFLFLDTYNNGTIKAGDFLKFWRLSFVYLELDPTGLCILFKFLEQITSKDI